MNTLNRLRLSWLWLVVGALALMACLVAVQPVRGADHEAIHAKVVKATGFVVVHKADNKIGYGSCWIVDQQKKLVITNTHVVGDTDTCRVAFPQYVRGQLMTNSEMYYEQDFISGTVIARDSKRDLALIQLDRLPAGVEALELAPTSIAPGGKIFAVGNAGMAGKHLNQGTLWRQRQGTVKKGFFWMTSLKGSHQKIEMRMIQTDSGGMPGDSGGPVVDEQGRLVGVNSANNDAGDYAVDVSEVRVFLSRWVSTSNLPPPETGFGGTWTVTWTRNGQEYFSGLTLNNDGTGQWDANGNITVGTYTHTDGRLTMNIPGGFNGSGQVVWESNNRFRLTVQFSDMTIEFTITRR